MDSVYHSNGEIFPVHRGTTIIPWTQGTTGSSPQEFIGGASISDPTSATHTPYPDVWFGQDSPSVLHERAHQDTGFSTLGQGFFGTLAHLVDNPSLPVLVRQNLLIPLITNDMDPPSQVPRLIKVPQEPYIPKTEDRSFLQLQGATFCTNGTPGFNLQWAFDRNFTNLDGADDPILEDANGPVSCRLSFPGYPTPTKIRQIPVKNWKKKPTPVIRSKLAHEIAKRIKQYLDEMTSTPINPLVDPRWTVGQGYMKLEKMYLFSFSRVSKGSLQPEIWVVIDNA